MRYFGYGSNLHVADFVRWCEARGLDGAGVRPVTRAWLPDHEPVFHYRSAARGGGALSVRPRLGSAVPGMLFDVDQPGSDALDRKEGAPRFYERVPCVALLPDGAEEPAFTYVVTPSRREPAHVPPTGEYLAIVEDGLRAHGLPTGQVQAASRGFALAPLPSAVFVYGTLLRGEVRAPLLERHDPVRWVDAHTRGELLDLGPYPGLRGGAHAVAGELVELRDPGGALAELDEVEDFLGYGVEGSLYRRVIVDVEEAGGAPPSAARTVAWTYLYLGGGDHPRIASGDWRTRRAAPGSTK